MHAPVIKRDVELLATIEHEIAAAEESLAEILPRTPVAVLLSLSQVNTVRASMYGAALGDLSRFRTAAQVYRFSGLVPRLYESAGGPGGGGISREGKVELREAISELGKALRQGVPDVGAYSAALTARGKPRGHVAGRFGAFGDSVLNMTPGPPPQLGARTWLSGPPR